MILSRFLRSRPDPAARLYERIVAAARQPKPYAEWGVPDTIGGRFEMIILCQYLVLNRLKAMGAAQADVSQKLTDAFFTDMDRSLREMGVGDLSVGKKVRRMAESYHGRFKAYGTAGEDPVALAAALRRNVYAGEEGGNPEALAVWTLRCGQHLRDQPDSAILAGEFTLP
jgi:cytochrome b pre-mRNA-processing protein 3